MITIDTWSARKRHIGGRRNRVNDFFQD
ncbi:MAG: hypothetical protein D4R44_03415 [Actinobacteria bacterium]|nr:MAG: hypothetical protein D4R44_03415 [Actinomycetota bacterium]